jgi:hypothetical protein
MLCDLCLLVLKWVMGVGCARMVGMTALALVARLHVDLQRVASAICLG